MERFSAAVPVLKPSPGDEVGSTLVQWILHLIEWEIEIDVWAKENMS